MRRPLRAAILILLPLMLLPLFAAGPRAHAAEAELSRMTDPTLVSMATRVRILAEKRSGLFVARLAVIDGVAGCETAPGGCPPSPLFVAVSLGGAAPADALYLIAAADHWTFNGWKNTPKPDVFADPATGRNHFWVFDATASYVPAPGLDQGATLHYRVRVNPWRALSAHEPPPPPVPPGAPTPPAPSMPRAPQAPPVAKTPAVPGYIQTEPPRPGNTPKGDTRR